MNEPRVSINQLMNILVATVLALVVTTVWTYNNRLTILELQFQNTHTDIGDIKDVLKEAFPRSYERAVSNRSDKPAG